MTREQLLAKFRAMHIISLFKFCRQYADGAEADVAWDVLRSRLPAESMVRERDSAVAAHNELIKSGWAYAHLGIKDSESE